MKIAFAGTPEFARVALQALHEAGHEGGRHSGHDGGHDGGHELVLVLTQPDRPAGRGLKLQASPVKQQAQAAGVPVLQPRSLRLDGKYPEDAAAAQAALLKAAPDVMIVAAYGLILPAWVLALPSRGCINIHGSLLPRWRGAAPIHRAIEAGDTQTGITIMQMDAGLDTGPMLLAQAEPIRPDDTTASLHDRLAALGARLLLQALASPMKPVAQPDIGVSYAHKVDKTESLIDWRQSAVQIERRLRAFDPAPGCSTFVAGQPVKVWRGRVCSADSASGATLASQSSPGYVLRADEGGCIVACGEAALELLELQAAGGRRVSAREFLQRHPLLVGSGL